MHMKIGQHGCHAYACEARRRVKRKYFLKYRAVVSYSFCILLHVSLLRVPGQLGVLKSLYIDVGLLNSSDRQLGVPFVYLLR